MFVLAQLSDPHLGPLPQMRQRDLTFKQRIGLFNWHRNRAHAFDGEILEALIEDIRAHKPDHIAVTGDLVNIALSAEFLAARDWLASFGSPDGVTVIPGNHDAYIAGAFDELSEIWRDFMSHDEGTGETADFPFIRRRGPVALIGLSSAVATAPFMATGRFLPDQAKALGQHLARLGDEECFRIVMIHHPPIAGLSAWTRRLIGADLVRAEIARHGAELVLHGHNHRMQISRLAGSNGDVPVVGATAASSAPRPNSSGGAYHLFQIENTDGQFTCAMSERGVRQAGGEVETLSQRVLIGG
jgi:3',5'-cyclic AMP phosphodiesterase CpdA